MVDRIGQQLGNYHLIGLLGHGALADVYLGEHIYLKTYAAIKVLHAQLAGSELPQFLQEARLLNHLRHPNIVKVLEFGLADNTPFLVVDYAPNGSLRQRHTKGVPLPLHIIMPYVKQVASALSYAHEQKVIHCDVKPENMLLGQRNEVLLSDFGLAVITQSSYYQTQEMTGTIQYMAPEQIQGTPGPASDQYALGITIYEWLSGSVPFVGSFAEIANQHLFTPPPSLRQSISTISPDVEQVLMIALNKAPQQRFRSVQAFANALEQASQPTLIRSKLADPPAHVEIAEVPTSPLHSPEPGTSTPQFQHTSSTNQTVPDPTPPATPQLVLHATTLPSTPLLLRRPSAALAALISVLVVLIIGSSGLAYYLTSFRPAQLHAEATATAQALLRGTAQAHAAGTASAVAATATITHLTPEELYARVTSGTPVFDDPLNSQNDTNWNTYAARDGTGCGFVGGVMHGTAAPNGVATCFAAQSNYRDFAFQVQMTLIRGDGNNLGGLLFRSDSLGADAYYFVLSAEGLYILVTGAGTQLGGGTSSLINVGLNQSNVFTVIARGSSIYLYANGQYLTKATDNSYQAGEIGLVAMAFQTAHLTTDVIFQNVKVWTL